VDGKFLEQAWVVVFSSLDDLKGKFAKSQSQ
jgi:hypothetical protein